MESFILGAIVVFICWLFVEYRRANQPVIFSKPTIVSSTAAKEEDYEVQVLIDAAGPMLAYAMTVRAQGLKDGSAEKELRRIRAEVQRIAPNIGPSLWGDKVENLFCQLRPTNKPPLRSEMAQRFAEVVVRRLRSSFDISDHLSASNFLRLAHDPIAQAAMEEVLHFNAAGEDAEAFVIATAESMRRAPAKR